MCDVVDSSKRDCEEVVVVHVLLEQHGELILCCSLQRDEIVLVGDSVDMDMEVEGPDKLDFECEA